MTKENFALSAPVRHQPERSAKFDPSFNMSELIAALIGGGFTLAGVGITKWYTASNDVTRAQQQTVAVLKAIKHELVITMEIFRSQGGDELKNLAQGAPFDWIMSIEEDYFIVYPRNSEIVGQIEDEELVRLIIQTYTRANVFMDSLRINNGFVAAQRERNVEIASISPDCDTKRNKATPRIREAYGDIEELMICHAKGLKKQYDDLIASVTEFQKRLDLYLKSGRKARPRSANESPDTGKTNEIR